MSQHQEEVRRSQRIGRSIGGYRADSPQASTTRNSASPRRKPRKNDKPKKKIPNLTQGLSILTSNMVDVPVRDMEAWVNRPLETRQKEAEQKRGNIARPMNSFMLYRSAYADRAKAWCEQTNHQIVSSVAGASWNLESETVHKFYDDLSKIERANHQLAHPNYKFSPAKPGASKKRKTEEEGLSDADADWAATHRIKKRIGRDASYPARGAPLLPSNDQPGYLGHYHTDQYWTSRPQPHPYGTTPIHGIHHNFVDNMYPTSYYDPTPPPVQHHRFQQPNLGPEHGHLGGFSSSGILGMPGAPIHELTDIRSQAHTPAAPIDPRLDHELEPLPYLPYNITMAGNGNLSYEETYSFPESGESHIPMHPMQDPEKRATKHQPVQPIEDSHPDMGRDEKVRQDSWTNGLGDVSISGLDQHPSEFDRYMGGEEHDFGHNFGIKTSENGDKSPKTT